MRAMRLPKSVRRAVALITAALLLLCQVAFAAQACANGIGSVGSAPAAQAPCHGVGAEDASGVPAATPSCEASNALADSAKLPIFDVTDWPAVAIARLIEPYPLANLASAPQAVNAVCHSPPLSILHCRLLN